MAEPINLRQARKARERADRRKAAEENAARHGLTKAEKRLIEARAAKAHALLDAHRREDGDDGDGDGA